MAGSAALPAAVMEWIAATLNASDISVSTRAGGGASREGAVITVIDADGRDHPYYLSLDSRPEAERRRPSFRREISAIRALGQAGLRVPRVVASNEELLAFMTQWVPGEARFDLIGTEEQRQAVAHDFAAELAALHALRVENLALEGFAQPAPVSAYLRARLQELRVQHARGDPDPLLVFALGWLDANIPGDPERTVLVHGDAGPANFLYVGDRVTAILDWELTHLGDPMEDLAWICVRNLFVPFVGLPGVFKAYAEASGCPIDLQKVRYYRIYALITLVVDTHAQLRQGTQPLGGGTLGNYLMYYTCHMRALVQALAESMGVAPLDAELPNPPPSPEGRFYGLVLEDLRHQLLPFITDTRAVHSAKSLARAIKYLEQKARLGTAFDAMERFEIDRAVGPDGSNGHGRSRLLDAMAARRVSNEALLQIFHHRMRREVALMAAAMGGLADRSLAPIE